MEILHLNSDKSSKDFRVTSTLKYIADICLEIILFFVGILDIQNVTGLHTQLGQSIKIDIKYHEFLVEHWQQERFKTKSKTQKMILNGYYVIDHDGVDKKIPKYDTLKGMSDYYCFVFKEKGKVMYRNFN